jgi:hypothetical protein
LEVGHFQRVGLSTEGRKVAEICFDYINPDFSSSRSSWSFVKSGVHRLEAYGAFPS